MAKTYKTIKISPEIDDLDELEFECQVEIEYSIDPSYGEDADGNRGTPLCFIDDISVISCFDSTGNEINPQTIPNLEERIASEINDLE